MTQSTPPPRSLWSRALHCGLFPLVETAKLERLRDDLASGSWKLCQGATTDPPPLHGLRAAKCFAACLMASCVWDDGMTCGSVDDAFIKLVMAMENRDVAEHGIEGRHKWAGQIILAWDHAPRAEAFAAVLEEVESELKRRTANV